MKIQMLHEQRLEYNVIVARHQDKKWSLNFMLKLLLRLFYRLVLFASLFYCLVLFSSRKMHLAHLVPVPIW